MMTETLWICGRPWTVEVVDELIESDNFGECDAEKQRIVVSEKGVCRDSVRESVLHEVLHALTRVVSNGWRPDEETGVQATTVGLYSVVSDARNLWLWTLLLEMVATLSAVTTDGTGTAKNAPTGRSRSAAAGAASAATAVKPARSRGKR